MSNKKLRRATKRMQHAVQNCGRPATQIPEQPAAQPAEQSCERTVEAASTDVTGALKAALEAVDRLTEQRLREKLSISRLAGVARELKELIKVVSVYGV